MNYKEAKELAKLVEFEDRRVELEGFIREGKNYICIFRDMRNGYTFEVGSFESWQERKKISEVISKEVKKNDC